MDVTRAETMAEQLEIDGQLRRLKRKQARLRSQLAEVTAEIREVALRRPGKHPVRRTADLDAHQQAGRRNIAAMREEFRTRGRATQAVAAAAAGVGKGTSTWTIRALREDGVIKPTGKKIGGSAEFRYASPDRTTRRRPGE